MRDTVDLSRRRAERAIERLLFEKIIEEIDGFTTLTGKKSRGLKRTSAHVGADIGASGAPT